MNGNFFLYLVLLTLIHDQIQYKGTRVYEHHLSFFYVINVMHQVPGKNTIKKDNYGGSTAAKNNETRMMQILVGLINIRKDSIIMNFVSILITTFLYVVLFLSHYFFQIKFCQMIFSVAIRSNGFFLLLNFYMMTTLDS